MPFNLLREIFLLIICVFPVLGFIGLGLCAIVDKLFLETPIIHHPIWSIPFYIALALFFIPLIIVLPIQVLVLEPMERKKNKIKLEKMTTKDALRIFLPFTTPNPDAIVPKWISAPITIILVLLLAIFLLIALGCLIAYFLR